MKLGQVWLLLATWASRDQVILLKPSVIFQQLTKDYGLVKTQQQVVVETIFIGQYERHIMMLMLMIKIEFVGMFITQEVIVVDVPLVA